MATTGNGSILGQLGVRGNANLPAVPLVTIVLAAPIGTLTVSYISADALRSRLLL